jgi:xylan 1,4-beta-xylosidase
LAVAVWNLFLPEEAGSPKTFALHFSGVKAGKTVGVTIIDKEHGSPLPAYEKMGRPQFPSRQQIETLRKAAAMPSSEEQTLKNGELKLTLQPHSLALIEVAN